mmetsp:Transcript_5347/g.10974  ORF Transcript_5347/g.10974 Transcript_5347/m.10974 type:complete len:408 (-) Transcript_5347:58-1281(-)
MMISAAARSIVTKSARMGVSRQHCREVSMKSFASRIIQSPSNNTNNQTTSHKFVDLPASLNLALVPTQGKGNIRRLSSAGELPYHIVVGMPALSPTMSSGNISKWNVAEGDSFSAGDSLAVIETDKATMDFEAQDDGIVAKILVPEGGGELEVGIPIMVTVEEAADVASFANFTPDAAPAPVEEVAAPAPATPAPAAAPATPAKDLPYHIVVGMPALSPTMDAGTISKWNVSEGDSFAAGDSIAVIETDKASMDFEAQDDGIVAKILVPPGSGEISVGVPIMVTVEEEGDIPAFKDFVAGSAPDSSATEASVPAVEAEQPAAAPAPVVEPSAPSTLTAPAVAVEAPAAAAAPAPMVEVAGAGSKVVFMGGSSWGKLAAKSSPLAKALASKQKAYIEKYGNTGHIPIV